MCDTCTKTDLRLREELASKLQSWMDPIDRLIFDRKKWARGEVSNVAQCQEMRSDPAQAHFKLWREHSKPRHVGPAKKWKVYRRECVFEHEHNAGMQILH